MKPTRCALRLLAMFGAILPPFDAVGALDPVPVTGVTLVLENKGVRAPHNTTLFVAGDKLRTETGGAAVIFDGASKKIGAETRQHDWKFEPLGVKTTAGTFECEMHRVLLDGKLVEQACIAPWSAKVVTREDFAATYRRAVGCPTCVAGRPPG